MSGKRCIRVRVKIPRSPEISIPQMITAMREVFEPNGFQIDIVGFEHLDLPILEDVNVGTCSLGIVTDDQVESFDNRNNVQANELVIYFVRSTIPPSNGCASHPNGRPGAIVANGASQWTLGHEVGHILGLSHINNDDRLMTGNGTFNITNPPPNLTRSELNTMRASQLAPEC